MGASYWTSGGTIVPPLTNREMGEKIGVTHSAVSRIRNGIRKPSLEVMRKIDKRFGWTVQAQSASMQKGRYAKDFDLLVRGKHRVQKS